jgi:hypothetical protein
MPMRFENMRDIHFLGNNLLYCYNTEIRDKTMKKLVGFI